MYTFSFTILIVRTYFIKLATIQITEYELGSKLIFYITC